MTIEWRKTSEQLPEAKGDECLLYNEQSARCIGPIPWFDATTGWLDILATPEAGAVYDTKAVTHWAPFNHPEPKE
jgi:hypothetical protein